MKTIRSTHTGGETHEAPVTRRVICAAEEHAQVKKWATGDASRIRQAYYMAYLAEKFAKLTTLDFDAWLDGVDVDGVEITAAEADAGKPTA